MPKKIRRRAAVFHKKKVTFSKVLIGILVVVGCAGVLAGGYFTAKFSVEGWPFGGSAVSGGSAAPESVDSKPESQTPSSDPASVPPEPTPQTGGLRAFYAPLSLLRDQAALDAQLEAAAAAVCAWGLCGEKARKRMGKADGSGAYGMYLMDAVFHLTGEELEQGERYELR